jgi:hypothetical protein
MQFNTIPPQGGTARQVADVVRGIMNGKTNNTGTIDLATGWASTTTIYDERISYDSKIVLVPFSDPAEADAAPYGSFSNNNDQTAPSVGTTAVVLFDTTEESSGVYRDTVNTSRIYVRNYGIYNLQFSLQLVNYANSIEYADVWFRINGTDVPRSASRFDIQARKSAGVPNHVIGTVNVFLELQAGDYVELAGTTSSTNVALEHYAADLVIPRPAIPAAIFTVQYIAPLSSGNIYISAQQPGQATISHFANNTSGKTYGYIIVG